MERRAIGNSRFERRRELQLLDLSSDRNIDTMDDEEKKTSKIAFGDPTVPGVLPFDYLYAQLNSKPYR